MAKTPDDATRFTATGPYASNMSSTTNGNITASPTSTRIDFGHAPPNESPQQKIARLRAAAAMARRSKEDNFDKVVRIGRRWADRAHRVTALLLLGLTVGSVLVATAGITDMVIHNRRRRRDWYAEQDIKRAADIHEAQAALAAGNVTQDQLLLLGQERAKQESAEARKNRPGMFKSATNYLFGGFTTEEQKGGRLGAAATGAGSKVNSIRETIEELAQEAKSKASPQAGPTSPAVQSPAAVAGGPLDRQAQQAYNAAIQQSQTWRDWLLRRS